MRSEIGASELSVAITFDDEDHSGLVAQNTLLWDAAKRMGVGLRADCNGRGECDACAVSIKQGAELLSPATAAEQKVLGAERLSQAERLACQTRLESAGEVIVRLIPIVASESKFQKRFRDLPFNQQVSSLIEIEAVAVTESLNTIRGKYLGFVEKLMNLAPPKDGAKGSAKKE
jgi:ferredoxin